MPCLTWTGCEGGILSSPLLPQESLGALCSLTGRAQLASVMPG